MVDGHEFVTTGVTMCVCVWTIMFRADGWMAGWLYIMAKGLKSCPFVKDDCCVRRRRKDELERDDGGVADP